MRAARLSTECVGMRMRESGALLACRSPTPSSSTTKLATWGFWCFKDPVPVRDRPIVLHTSASVCGLGAGCKLQGRVSSAGSWAQGRGRSTYLCALRAATAYGTGASAIEAVMIRNPHTCCSGFLRASRGHSDRPRKSRDGRPAGSPAYPGASKRAHCSIASLFYRSSVVVTHSQAQIAAAAPNPLSRPPSPLRGPMLPPGRP